jgi:hypothetical protein
MTFDRLIEFQIHLFQILGGKKERKERERREKERESDRLRETGTEYVESRETNKTDGQRDINGQMDRRTTIHTFIYIHAYTHRQTIEKQTS